MAINDLNAVSIHEVVDSLVTDIAYCAVQFSRSFSATQDMFTGITGDSSVVDNTLSITPDTTSRSLYHYKYRTSEMTLKAGDLVVVESGSVKPTEHSFGINGTLVSVVVPTVDMGKITYADEDDKSPIRYAWVLAKVGTLSEAPIQEAELAKTLTSHVRTQRRRQVIASLYGADINKLESPLLK